MYFLSLGVKGLISTQKVGKGGLRGLFALLIKFMFADPGHWIFISETSLFQSLQFFFSRFIPGRQSQRISAESRTSKENEKRTRKAFLMKWKTLHGSEISANCSNSSKLAAWWIIHLNPCWLVYVVREKKQSRKSPICPRRRYKRQVQGIRFRDLLPGRSGAVRVECISFEIESSPDQLQVHSSALKSTEGRTTVNGTSSHTNTLCTSDADSLHHYSVKFDKCFR